jgi:hypothetical protein
VTNADIICQQSQPMNCSLNLFSIHFPYFSSQNPQMRRRKDEEEREERKGKEKDWREAWEGMENTEGNYGNPMGFFERSKQGKARSLETVCVMYVCTYVCMYVCIMCVCVCMYVCMHACMFVCVCSLLARERIYRFTPTLV